MRPHKAMRPHKDTLQPANDRTLVRYLVPALFLALAALALGLLALE